MATDYYAVVAGHRIGPVSAAQLEQYELHADTWVWRAGLPDWQRAGCLAELQAVLSPASDAGR